MTKAFLALTVTLALLATTLFNESTVRAQEAAPAAAPEVTREQLEAALVRYRSEPSATRVARAAANAQSANASRVRDAMDRARGTGWLPTVRTGLRRGQAIDLRGLTGDGTEGNVSIDDDLVFNASMTFRFDRIVFASEEVGLLRELRAIEHTELQLMRVVVHLYFERRRLQLERDLLHVRDIVHALRILELEALLDGFTDGAFTRMLTGADDD